jgi:hypothetical protein
MICSLSFLQPTLRASINFAMVSLQYDLSGACWFPASGKGGRFLSITKQHTIFLCAFGLVRTPSVLRNVLSSNQMFCGDGGAAGLADNHTGTAETREKRCMPIIVRV